MELIGSCEDELREGDFRKDEVVAVSINSLEIAVIMNCMNQAILEVDDREFSSLVGVEKTGVQHLIDQFEVVYQKFMPPG